MSRIERRKGVVRGRFAPSPTGDMHVGNAFSALLAWLSVRSRGGVMVLRMEDLDLPRVHPGSAERILEDLEWLGLDWDEGPHRSGDRSEGHTPERGPYGPYHQSARFDLYEQAFRRLQELDAVYPCFCSRRDVASAAAAPQEPGDELRYPGTCREVPPEEASRRIAGGERHAWRFRVDREWAPEFQDRVCGPQGGEGRPAPGDFVVRRYDGSPSYQLAVIVDDLLMKIDEVVRGDDLLPSAARQVLLAEALEGHPPTYGHVPLILGGDGIRLSKRHQGVILRELREAGWSPERLVGELARLAGLRADRSPVSAGDLVAGFSLNKVAGTANGVRWDPCLEPS